MEFVQGSLYFVSDEFFDIVQDSKLMVNYETTRRPHYYAVRDKKTSLLWMIPCSSRVDKYKSIIADRRKRNKTTIGIRIARAQNVEMVMLLQNMFPVRECYVTDRYFRGGEPMMIANRRLVEEIEKDVARVIMMMRHGVKLFGGQPDAMRIEKLMLEELAQAEE